MFDTYSLRLSSPLRSLLFISLVLGLFVACQPSDAPPETAEEVADTVATTEADGPTLDDALQAFRQQDLESTTDILQQITANDPEHVLAWNYLSTAFKLQKRYEDAEAPTRKVLVL